MCTDFVWTVSQRRLDVQNEIGKLLQTQYKLKICLVNYNNFVMGNQAGSLKKHLETAEKTGALNFTDKGLEKFPPDLVKVIYI